ncbi:unnamed protein product, partial [Sphacelaria rigidula]
TINRTERGQRLRAVNWVKQVRNELIAAEFALNLAAPPTLPGSSAGKTGDPESGGEGGGEAGEEGSQGANGPEGGKGNSDQARGGIDYDRIADRLEGSLRTLQAGRPLAVLEAVSQEELGELSDRLKTNIAKIRKVAQADGRGMGSSSGAAAGTAGNVFSGGDTSGEAGQAVGGEDAGGWKDPGGIVDSMKSLTDVKKPEFDLFLRDDGTVDWDGAIQSGREVARFGQELWDRINGQNPHDEGALAGGGHGGADKSTRELPEDSAAMVSLGAVEAVLSARVEQLQKELDAMKADARAQEKKWTNIDRRNAQRGIRDKEKVLATAQRQLRLHKIDVDMERVCYIIEQDIRESTTSSSSENRLLVAEFGLLDAQLANLKRIVSEMTKAEDGTGLNGDSMDIDGLELDEDELELVSREVLDLKNRLGMDLENPAFTFDVEKATR